MYTRTAEKIYINGHASAHGAVNDGRYTKAPEPASSAGLPQARLEAHTYYVSNLVMSMKALLVARLAGRLRIP
eukprot:7979847-Karenia_brevis.AAC.1